MDQLALFEEGPAAAQVTIHYTGRGHYGLSIRRYTPGAGWALNEVYDGLGRAEVLDVICAEYETLWR